jgi:GR25 family glycosyltransferase involved in LPS biosynthesis
MPKLPVIIIGAVGSKRLEYFRTHPEISNYLEPKYLDAIMLSEKDADSLVGSESIQYQKILYGRKLLNTEIGCAASHRLAQLEAAKSERGVLILEDDARFHDLATLSELIAKFLHRKKGKAAILSLFDGRNWSSIDLQYRNKHPFVRNIGPTSGAVAYALTPEAGRILAGVNESNEYLADWPPSGCTFYTSTLDLISHGDSTTTSTIDTSGIRSTPTSAFRRLQIISGGYYLSEGRGIGSFRKFMKEIWLPRVKYYLSVIRFNYIRFRNSKN